MKSAGSTPFLMMVLSPLLLQGAYFGLTLPAGEFPPAGYVGFDIGLDLLMTLVLAGLVVQLRRSGPLSGLAVLAVVLGLSGVAAGLVKLGIRFTSDHGLWTGHFLPPVL